MNDKIYNIPSVDIYETGEKFVLVLDMPGTVKENIEISTEGEELIVTGKINEDTKDWKPVVSEFKLNDYKRSFTIGNKVKRDNINAKYEAGILTIELEKTEAAKPRKIDVRVA